MWARSTDQSDDLWTLAANYRFPKSSFYNCGNILNLANEYHYKGTLYASRNIITKACNYNTCNPYMFRITGFRVI